MQGFGGGTGFRRGKEVPGRNKRQVPWIESREPSGNGSGAQALTEEETPGHSGPLKVAAKHALTAHCVRSCCSASFRRQSPLSSTGGRYRVVQSGSDLERKTGEASRALRAAQAVFCGGGGRARWGLVRTLQGLRVSAAPRSRETRGSASGKQVEGFLREGTVHGRRCTLGRAARCSPSRTRTSRASGVNLAVSQDGLRWDRCGEG